jgi:type IV secretory pathway VirB4 component
MRSRLAERDGHRATTATAQAIYPFVAEGGLGGRGVYIGRDLYGGSFCFDAFELYRARVLTNPNVLVIGAVGAAKSSLIKTYLFRQAVFGRIPWITDPKGEYGPLATALGVEPIRVVPGGDVTLNPLAPHGGWESQLSLLLSVAAGALGRDLWPEEQAALREALALLNSGDREPTLPQVVELVLRPPQQMAERLATSVTELARASRQAALGLQRLCDGELRGMFDAPTTPGLRLDGRAVVLDLSAVYHSTALGILMTCAAAWQRAAIAAQHEQADRDGRTTPKVINVADEAWKILGVRGIGEWLQDSFKRSRAYGIQNVIVMHRLSDLSAAGAAGSREVALAEGLLHDAQTRVVYAQYEDEVPRVREALGLTSVEAEILPQLDPGIALWKVGRRSFLVQHRYAADEAQLVDTDTRMLDGAPV